MLFGFYVFQPNCALLADIVDCLCKTQLYRDVLDIWDEAIAKDVPIGKDGAFEMVCIAVDYVYLHVLSYRYIVLFFPRLHGNRCLQVCAAEYAEIDSEHWLAEQMYERVVRLTPSVLEETASGVNVYIYQNMY